MHSRFFNKPAATALLALGLCGFLTACGTTKQSPEMGKRSDEIASAVEKARVASGDEVKSLGAAERAYKKAPQDQTAAADYARALREENMLDKAELVLEPFAEGPEPSSYTLSEFAAIQLKKGSPNKAERYAQRAVIADNTNYRAYHNLGVALEAQTKHEEAERAFRKGLEIWQGDPTPIMNNLALNLAAQGYLDESIEILRKAQSMDPKREEVERNLRIVTALQQAARGPTPMPPKKPAS